MTASLRERLEAKSRRTTTLPVLVGDAEAAAAEVATLRAALDVQLRIIQERREGGAEPTDTETAAAEKTREQLSAAKKRQAETVVEVQIQSLPPDEWDALCDGLPDDPETGAYDISELRASIMAACCVAEDLRDADWWEEQFKRPEWSKGELLAVNMTLLNLNLSTPSGFAGKG